MTPLPSDQRLLAAAREAMTGAYAPYSHFLVGAALLTDHGRVVTGANVENASYGLTICAERAAVVRAVNEGGQRIVAIAIVSSGGEPTWPCGACRQVLHEFGPAMRVVTEKEDGSPHSLSLRDLLPEAFGPDNLAE